MSRQIARQSAKVDEIRARIVQEARAEADRIVAEAKAAAGAAVAKARADADADVARRDKAAREEAERARKQRLAAAHSGARARLLSARAAALEDAYATALGKLQGLRDEPGYAEWLKALLVEAVLALRPHEDLEVLVDARDEKLASDDFLGSVEIVLTFSHNLAVRLALASERIETSGGVIVRARGGNIRCDNTFEERLRGARPELFRRVSSEILGE